MRKLEKLGMRYRVVSYKIHWIKSVELRYIDLTEPTNCVRGIKFKDSGSTVSLY